MTKSGSTSTTKYLGGQGQTGKPPAKRDSGGQFVSRTKPAKRKKP
jgi:predicted HicB family RNase H-like nuclease